MPNTTSPLPQRRCKYCKAFFQPERSRMVFCKTAHRKLFWKYGSLPLDKLMDRVRKEVRGIVKEEIAEFHKQQPAGNQIEKSI